VYKLTTAKPTTRSSIYDWRIESRAFGSLSLWVLGNPDSALRVSAESLDGAGEEPGSTQNENGRTVRRQRYSQLDVISALWWSSVLHLLVGDWRTGFTRVETGIRIAEEHNFSVLALVCSVCRGWARARLGSIGVGIEELVQCRAYLSTTPNMMVPWVFMAL